jgi:hypothetical protein
MALSIGIGGNRYSRIFDDSFRESSVLEYQVF